MVEIPKGVELVESQTLRTERQASVDPTVVFTKRKKVPLRPPQYLDEVECFVGLPAYKDHRENVLLDNFASIKPSKLGARTLLYTSALRILAIARNEDRQISKRREPTVDAQTFNDRWAQTLTASGIAELADSYKVEIDLLARQLSMRHNMERFLKNEQERKGLRPRQHPYLESIATFLETDATPVTVTDELGQESTYFSQGATVVAPTGSGKTVLMAHTVKGVGIGKPVEGSRGENGRLRALIIVPTQALVKQFKGEIGDNTFKRFAPDVTVGGYYEEERDDQSDVVVITQDKFITDFRDGQLNGESFDIALLDEAHHLTASAFLDVFRTHWKGPVLGFTGTPDYSPTKDVRMILPYEIYHGDTLSYIKDGALNAGQLLMFRVDPLKHKHLLPAGADLEDPHVRRELGEQLLDKSVVDFALTMLKKGRRGMIFCGYGEQSAHARHLAKLLSGATESGKPIILPNGKRIRAEAIGSFRTIKKDGSLSLQVMSEYTKGNIDVMTTTEMGREGYNDADIDFVIIAGRVLSLLKLKQIIGRGTRLSENFPTTVYAQFFLPTESDESKPRTLYEAFGLEKVEQGTRIGPRSRLADNQREINPSRLPRHLKEMSESINLLPVAQAVAAKIEIEIPQGFKRLDVTIGDTHYTEIGARKLLDKQGFAWRGRSEIVNGERIFVRYYEPAAAEYLKKHKKAPFVTSKEISITRLAKKMHVSAEFLCGRVEYLRAKGDVSLVKRTSGGKEFEYLDQRSRAFVEQYIREIPKVNESDVMAQSFARKLGYETIKELTEKEGIEAVYKEVGTSKVFKYVIEGEVAQRLMAKFSKADDEMTRADICKLVGLNQGEINNLMTPEEFAQGRLLNKRTRLWSKEEGMKIVERLKERHDSLPPHMITLQVVAAAVPGSEFKIRKDFAHVREMLALPQAPKSICYPWGVLKEAQEKYDSNIPFSINYDLLPNSPDETDPDRIAYAKGLQYALVQKKERLGFSEEELRLAKVMAERIIEYD